jgi:hypothetical protein
VKQDKHNELEGKGLPVDSHDRKFGCTEALVGFWEGGSHIDVFDGSINLCTSVARMNTNSMEWEATKDGSINLCTSVARINTNSMEWEATKEEFHQNWWEMQGRSPSAFPLAVPSDPESHQPPRQLALPPRHYIILAIDQSVFFGDVPNYPMYAYSGCR